MNPRARRLRLALFAPFAAALAFSASACDDEPRTVSGFVSNRSPLPDVVTSGDTITPVDTLVQDTAVADTAVADTAPADTAIADTTPVDTAVADTTPADTTIADTTPADTSPPMPEGPVDINTGFIGGACTSTANCNFASSRCIPASEGWPGGTCTQPCTSTCPDQANMSVTFCVDGDSVDQPGGVCLQKCDMAKSPTGCRDGYTCGDELRYNTTNVSSWMCLPGEYQGCLQTLIALGVPFTLPGRTTFDTVAGSTDVCDVFEPITVGGTINGVRFHPSDFTNAPAEMYVQCGVALALFDMAALMKTRGITDVVHYGTYNCRYIAGTTSFSQHAFANAIDIAGVQTSTGQRYTVLSHWEDGVADPTTPGGELLFWLAHAMHDEHIWNVILTPEYNDAHNDHLHVDLTPGSWFLSE